MDNFKVNLVDYGNKPCGTIYYRNGEVTFEGEDAQRVIAFLEKRGRFPLYDGKEAKIYSMENPQGVLLNLFRVLRAGSAITASAPIALEEEIEKGMSQPS